MAISRIAAHHISVQPETDRVRIIGAHVRPYGLARLTPTPVRTLPWLIHPAELFGPTAHAFRQKMEGCSDPEQMFDEVEKTFLDAVLVRDLSLITRAVERIEHCAGNISLAALSEQLAVSDRTLRNHFYDQVGCAPKEYIRLVKLKQAARQMKHSEDSLTEIAYDNAYFDQAHFIHEVKQVTGRSPNALRKEMPRFRFLQF
jgi:AraC-like DNA-binding protein